MENEPAATHRQDAGNLDEALDVAYRAFNQGNAAARQWSNVLFVDRDAVIPVAQQDGSRAYPFNQVQRAVDAIPPATSLADELVFWHVLIANGSTPPEAPKVKGRRRILLDFVSGLPTLAGLEFNDDMPGFGAPFALLYVRGFAVAGDITTADGGLANVTVLALEGVDNTAPHQINGNAHAVGPVLLMLDDPNVFKIVGPTVVIQDVKGGQIAGDVNVAGYGRIEACELGDPALARSWTIVNVPQAAGFYGCVFDAPVPGGFTFTGPQSSFRVDATSNYWATAQGGPVALGGAATKVLISTGLVATAHADNGANNMAIPMGPAFATLCTTPPIHVESLQAVRLFARTWYENANPAIDALDLAIVATPTNPAGPGFIVDAVQDQIDASTDGCTTLAGVETLLPGVPNDFTFSLQASVALGTAAATVLGGPGAPPPGPAFVPGATIAVDVVNI